MPKSPEVYTRKELETARENSLLSLLRRTSEHLRITVRAEFESAEIGRMKKSHIILLLNLDLDGIRISELARRSGLTSQTIGTRVREMAELGIVVLEADPSDGRAKLVVPTATGAKHLYESVGIIRHITEQYANVIGQRRMTQLHSTLKMMLKEIEGASI